MLTKNTSELRALVQEHVAADQVMQGTYWHRDRGCFIGCLNHGKSTENAESKFGLPAIIQRIAESIFEQLPADEAVAFFASFPDAIQCDGKDLIWVAQQFLAAEETAHNGSFASAPRARRRRDCLLRLIRQAPVVGASS